MQSWSVVFGEQPSASKWNIIGDNFDYIDNELTDIDTDLTALFAKINTGWIPATETWTRTGNHTFTVSGDLTAKYRKGTKVRYRDGGSDEYGVIGNSSHSTGTTTITLITNTDFEMAAATITDTFVSYIENPEGWPHWFNYTPTYSALSPMTYGTVTTELARWSSRGNTLDIELRFSGTTGGSASTSIQATLPIAIIYSGFFTLGVHLYDDTGTDIGTVRSLSGGSQLQFVTRTLTPWGLGSGRLVRATLTTRF